MTATQALWALGVTLVIASLSALTQLVEGLAWTHPTW